MTYYTGSNIKTEKDGDNPCDTISCIVWDPFDRQSKSFLTAGWDGFIRFYQIEGTSSKRLDKKWEYFFEHPVLTCDINIKRFVFAGLATGHIVLVDMMNSSNFTILGAHDAPICRLIWVQEFTVLISLGFDNLMKIFSLQPQNNGNFQIDEYKLPAKTNAVAYSFPYVLIGAQDSKVAILNVQKLKQTNFSAQYQQICEAHHGIIKFTCAAIFDGKKSVILGTADGRLICSNYTDRYNGIQVGKAVVHKYQKTSSYRKDLCGQMNAVSIGFKDNKQEFCIFAGTEEMGVYSIDKNTKIKALGTQSATVTALSISPDCQYYAYGVGTDWLKGLQETLSPKTPKILVGKLAMSDVTPSTYVR